MQPDLLTDLLTHWPDELSGLCAFEVALSGGLDSVVLLSLLVAVRQQRPGIRLSAVHVHHGLNARADDWVQHCQALCAQWQVPLRVVRVQIALHAGQSLEAQAREARYAAFAQSAADVVVLAHHLDDQAETILLQLLRGGGVHAVAGMPVLRRLVARQLWRPLLSIGRQQLEDYARQHGLRWVEDDSNQDVRFRRNLLRHRVMPVLQQGIPAYRQQLSRAGWSMAQAASLVDEIAEQDLQLCQNRHGISVPALLSLSPVRQGFMLIAWLRQQGQGQASPEQLQEFLRQLRESDAASCPQLPLLNFTLLRYRTQLYLLPNNVHPCVEPLVYLPGVDAYPFPSWGGQLCFEQRGGLSAALLNTGLFLRPRQGGEVLLQKMGRKTVKKLLQEAGIPPLLRERWPLLCNQAGRVLALPGIAVASDCYDDQGYWPVWLAG